MKMNRPMTLDELAALIPADQAQRIVAQALRAFGAQEEWDSETIEWVAEPFVPLAKSLSEHGVPSPFEPASEAYWRGIGKEEKEE